MMFELVFSSDGPNVKFEHSNGRIKFLLNMPVYLQLNYWMVGISKIVCNHVVFAEKQVFGAIYIQTNLVQTKMVNGYYQKLLYVAKLSNSNSCICDNVQAVSYCDVDVTELSEYDMFFVNAKGAPVNFDENFNFTIVLSFVEK